MEILYDFIFAIGSLFTILLVSFFVLTSIWIAYYFFCKKMRFQKGEYKYVGYGSKLKRIFMEFPRQLAFDIINRNPDEFRDYGFNMICGKQGTGKTITLVYLLLRYKKMYPKLKIATNLNYKYEDHPINSWKDIVFKNNGIYGQIDVLDEVQNWFNCNQSKDFPPEMLSEITQQRKQHKMIIGTSQVFNRVSKPIRENTYMLYEPRTIFGCITIVKKYDISCTTDGQVDNKKSKGMFFFIHNKEIREAFDTYKKIVDMAESGFIERTSQASNLQDKDNQETVQVKKIKIK